jgi:hypothetical protein
MRQGIEIFAIDPTRGLSNPALQLKKPPSYAITSRCKSLFNSSWVESSEFTVENEVRMRLAQLLLQPLLIGKIRLEGLMMK